MNFSAQFAVIVCTFHRRQATVMCQADTTSPLVCDQFCRVSVENAEFPVLHEQSGLRGETQEEKERES